MPTAGAGARANQNKSTSLTVKKLSLWLLVFDSTKSNLASSRIVFGPSGPDTSKVIIRSKNIVYIDNFLFKLVLRTDLDYVQSADQQNFKEKVWINGWTKIAKTILVRQELLFRHCDFSFFLF